MVYQRSDHPLHALQNHAHCGSSPVAWCMRVQLETRQPQHVDDPERRCGEGQPRAGEDTVGEHVQERQCAAQDRQRRQGQWLSQEVREGQHARLER